jgi:hypothetical protein
MSDISDSYTCTICTYVQSNDVTKCEMVCFVFLFFLIDFIDVLNIV